MKTIIYALTTMAAAVAPLIAPNPSPVAECADYSFPPTFSGALLVPTELSERELTFYREFPGLIGSYRLDGRSGESVILRYTDRPTRRMHAADGCYRASGYGIRFTDTAVASVAELSSEPVRFSQFRITEAGNPYLIRQAIVSLGSGITYVDIPSWYWKTMFGLEDDGPWIAVTWKLPDPDA